MTVSTIGQKIKKIREIKGFKQEYMAELLDISQQSYSNIESDKTDVPFSKIEKIAEVFQMRIEDLVCFDEKMVFNNYGTAHDKSFSVNYQSVGDKERELYEKTIQLLEDKIKYLESK